MIQLRYSHDTGNGLVMIELGENIFETICGRYLSSSVPDLILINRLGREDLTGRMVFLVYDVCTHGDEVDGWL